MNEFKIEGYEYTFRVKKMNAIEVMAMQTQFGSDTFDDAVSMFSTILEYIEVQCNDKWLPVKTKGMNVYYPPEVEHDIVLCRKLISKFGDEYLKPVFPKSGE